LVGPSDCNSDPLWHVGSTPITLTTRHIKPGMLFLIMTEKQNASQKAWSERNEQVLGKKDLSKKSLIRQFIDKYKENNSICIDCNTSYPPHMLDFDHLRDKTFNLKDASVSRASMDDVVAEINKCEIVCSNCHRHRTYMRSKNKTK
jgi:hypothetical protein